MQQDYQPILQSLPCELDETKTPYFSFTERHLHILWFEQKFLRQLHTHEGERIEVISPGIWNRNTGPDFIKAHVRIGQKSYRGDVEVHLHDGGWFQHGHHTQSQYNNVILHISFSPSSSPLLIYKENGEQILRCYLKESLIVSEEQFLASIDLDDYPDKNFFSKGRCAEHLFQFLSPNEISNFFESAAYWRLERKLSFLEQNCPSREMQFAGGIAMALGYKHNAKEFLDLFLYLMNLRDLPYDELLAVALGCSGFLEEGRHPIWELSSYYQNLRKLWFGRKHETIHQTQLKLDRIRPLHHPVRRIAYLIFLVQEHRLEKLWLTALDIWNSFISQASDSYRSLQKQLLDLLPPFHHHYWSTHYTFELKEAKKDLPGVGMDLRMQHLLNTTLPLLCAKVKESGSTREIESFKQFYHSLKVSPTSKSRYLQHRFFGNQNKIKLFEQALLAQGAYQLHHDFCHHFEASCLGCPFVDRYKAKFCQSR